MPKYVYVLEDQVTSLEECKKGYSIDAFESEDKLFERIQKIIHENEETHWSYKVPPKFPNQLQLVGYGKYPCWTSQEEKPALEDAIRTLTVRSVRLADFEETGV